VAGIERKDREFWKFVEGFDYVGLLETWVDQRKWESLRKRLPKGFVWSCQAAIREKKKGRPRGGIITGVKESWEILEGCEQVEGLVGRKIRVKEEIWNIWAVYSNREIDRIAREIEEKLEHIGEEVAIIGGDFNARIGEEESWYSRGAEEEQEKRKSKDKVKNGQGEK
ncbi:hypothetical protein WH47_10756, partial [Habropoda laboriosa]